MFVYTAKLSKKRVVVWLLVLAVTLTAIILIAGGGRRSIRDDGDVAEYLTELGWEIGLVPTDTQSIVIPDKLDEVYSDYNALQISQGFDLTKYAGMDAQRYTYEVKNFPGIAGSDKVYADIIVCKNRVVAGDIQSVSLGGFMQGLDYPG